MVFVATRYRFVEGEALGQRWIRLRERLGAPETTLKAYASDLNDYLRWCSSHDRPSQDIARSARPKSTFISGAVTWLRRWNARGRACSPLGVDRSSKLRFRETLTPAPAPYHDD
jgi:hypothetical protein